MAANKFKKAIETRQEEKSMLENQLDNTLINTLENKKENILEDNQEQDNTKGFDINDILDIKISKSKNKTYYLQEEVINAVVKTAKSKKVSESKVVNDLLKHILCN